jgi:hypothetical protein
MTDRAPPRSTLTPLLGQEHPGTVHKPHQQASSTWMDAPPRLPAMLADRPAA